MKVCIQTDHALPASNIMMSITTECSLCRKAFKTLYSLEKHTTQHHASAQDTVVAVFKDSTGRPVDLPLVKELLNPERRAGYKTWLSGLVEWMNSTLRPRLPGKIDSIITSIKWLCVRNNYIVSRALGTVAPLHL